MRAAGLSRPKEKYRSKQRMAFLSGLLHLGRQPAGGKNQCHGGLLLSFRQHNRHIVDVCAGGAGHDQTANGL